MVLGVFLVFQFLVTIGPSFRFFVLLVQLLNAAWRMLSMYQYLKQKSLDSLLRGS